MTPWILTDQQWAKLSQLIPEYQPSPLGGRPRASDKKAFQGILWILRTGAQWSALPRDRKTFSSKSTCWRKLKEWTDLGVFTVILGSFLAEMNGGNQIDWEESFVDGTFASAKKGVKKLVRRREGRVAK